MLRFSDIQDVVQWSSVFSTCSNLFINSNKLILNIVITHVRYTYPCCCHVIQQTNEKLSTQLGDTLSIPCKDKVGLV